MLSFSPPADMVRWGKKTVKRIALSASIVLCGSDFPPGWKTLSVFNKAENDLGALWYFIYHYNILLA